MKAHIIHAHPEPASFTAALKDAARDVLERRGWRVVVSDLYAEEFNPVAGRDDFSTVSDPGRFHYQSEQIHAHEHDGFAPDIRREQERFSGAALVVFTFPLWWGGVPAILKGWFDRVLAGGFAYVDGRRFDSGFFQGVACVAGITTGGTRQRFSKEGVYGDISAVMWPVQRCMFEYLGFTTAEPFVAYATPRIEQEERLKYIEDWRAYVAGIADVRRESPL